MKKNNDTFKTFYFLSLAWQLGFMIVVPIVGFLFFGRWIDSYLGTAPFALLGGIVIGLSVTVYEIYEIITPMLKDEGSGISTKYSRAQEKSKKNNKTNII